MTRTTFCTIAASVLLLATAASAGERPIGDPVEKFGMKVGAVYLQAVKMDPQDEMCGPADADIHLEADIHALKGNPNGLAKGEWIPYMGISYVLTKPGSDFTSSGPLVPMVANDGPHYGRNVKMAGPGTYHVAIKVNPPSSNGFYRHTDKETGVGQWWAPFTQEWDFTFVGSAGKKGGY
jgi:periplasmic iron binding protein